MLREWAGVVRRLVMGFDAAMMVVSFVAACAVRSAVDGAAFAQLLATHVWLLWVIVPTWIVALHTVGLYESIRYAPYWTVLRTLALGHASASVTLLGVLFMGHAWGVSRLLVQAFLVLSFLTLAGEKVVLRTLQRWTRGRGRNTRNVLIVGSNGLSDRYLDSLARHPFWGLRVIGVLAEDASAQRRLERDGDSLGRGRRGCASGPPILGTIDDLRDVLVARSVDEVALAVPAGCTSCIEAVVKTCLEKGVTTRVVLDLSTFGPHRGSVEMLGDVPVLSYQTTPPPSLATLAKRIIDIVGAGVGVVALCIVYCLYATRIRKWSGGSVLFKQVRIGQNGRRFVLYKFRTMRAGTEDERLTLSSANEMEGPIFKVKDDPRVTPIGKHLRSRHLDELPQFLNVLQGDMSLVGTRPPTPDEVAQYDLRHHARLAWRPGITGLWQVNGNHAVRTFEDILRLDREYVENWSLSLDLKIMRKTVWRMWQSDGW